MSSTSCIHWFRNGLRLHDNPCLLDASEKSNTLLPLYIIDPEAPFAQTQNRQAGCIRANFILESLRELDTKLGAMGSRLFVVRGKPHEVLPEIISCLDADDQQLYYEREPAAPIREADAKVLQAIREKHGQSNVEIKGYDTHTLHPMEQYVARCKDSVAPATFGGFSKIFNKMCVSEEVDTVSSVPPLPPKETMERLEKKFGLDNLGVPDLEQVGYDEKELENRAKGGIPFTGGEDAGLELLNNIVSTKPRWVSTFEKPKTSPNALTVDTTGLSPCK